MKKIPDVSFGAVKIHFSLLGFLTIYLQRVFKVNQNANDPRKLCSRHTYLKQISKFKMHSIRTQ